MKRIGPFRRASSQIREASIKLNSSRVRRGKTRRARARGRERGRDPALKIGGNKLSTIFAGLNTLKRLEIRPPGGPFVRRVAGDRAWRTAACYPRREKRRARCAGARRREHWREPSLLFLPPVVGVHSCARSGAWTLSTPGAPSNTPVDPATGVSAMIPRHAPWEDQTTRKYISAKTFPGALEPRRERSDKQGCFKFRTRSAGRRSSRWKPKMNERWSDSCKRKRSGTLQLMTQEYTPNIILSVNHWISNKFRLKNIYFD